MVYVRGNDHDFDKWQEAGNPTWNFKSVLPYFKKSEGLQIDDVIKMDGSSYYHNADGPMKIDLYHSNDTMKYVTIEAAQELGYKFLKDINAKEKIGVTLPHGTLDGNRRCTTAKAFLIPAKHRPNLFIIKYAHVTQLNINDGKEVTGVKFTINGQQRIANARKEVILSAGAVNTPQILMLSGIGPKDHLTDKGIKVVADLPVGKNLQDHPYVIIPLAIKQLNDSFVYESFTETFHKYLRGERGRNGIFDLLGFFDTKNPNGKYPDIEIHWAHFPKDSEETIRSYTRDNLGFNKDLSNTLIEANKQTPLFIALHILLNPKSHGEILLRSTDPFAHPIIRANLLSDIDDVKTLIRGIRLTQKFIQTDAYRRHQIEEIPLNIPECDRITDRNSDAHYECIVRNVIATLFHPAGTAKMGPPNDQSAVTDSRLRVRGVKGLRVVDASIMPDITSGNINAPVIMIGKFN